MACSCPPTRSTNVFFTKEARRYARQFKKRGLAKEQKLLLDGIARRPVDGISILEIGCGVGGAHLTLLGRGAREATGIDLAEGMIEAAKLLAAEFGYTDRVHYRLGDAVGIANELPAADCVIMDKVVCCYADLPALLATATGKAKTTLALTYPRHHFFNICSMKLLIAVRTLFRAAFVPSWHDWQAMERDIEQRGFRVRERSKTFIWNVAVFERPAASGAIAGTAV